jgi:uncharacterized protein YdiU (UPF0061 family)
VEQSVAWLEAHFGDHFARALAERLLARLGIVTTGLDRDLELLDRTFAFLQDSAMDYDQFFFDWYGGPASAARAMAGPASRMYADASFASVRQHLERHDPTPGVERELASPRFARDRPVSLLIDEVEAIWSRIAQEDDWSRFEGKVEEIRGEASGS